MSFICVKVHFITIQHLLLDHLIVYSNLVNLIWKLVTNMNYCELIGVLLFKEIHKLIFICLFSFMHTNNNTRNRVRKI